MSQIKNEIFLKQFGERIRKIRKGKGLTQVKLANDMDVEISQISRIERGIINTSISTVKTIADTLNVSIKELFDFEEETMKD